MIAVVRRYIPIYEYIYILSLAEMCAYGSAPVTASIDSAQASASVSSCTTDESPSPPASPLPAKRPLLPAAYSSSYGIGLNAWHVDDKEGGDYGEFLFIQIQICTQAFG